MLIEIYYKDPDAASDAAGIAIQKKHPSMKLYSKEYWDNCQEFMRGLVKVFGDLASGAEDLCINIDTDKPEIINVNGSKYRLVT